MPGVNNGMCGGLLMDTLRLLSVGRMMNAKARLARLWRHEHSLADRMAGASLA